MRNDDFCSVNYDTAIRVLLRDSVYVPILEQHRFISLSPENFEFCDIRKNSLANDFDAEAIYFFLNTVSPRLSAAALIQKLTFSLCRLIEGGAYSKTTNFSKYNYIANENKSAI